MPALTPDTAESAQRSVMDIFKPGLIVATVLITLGYFAHVTSFYFIIKWVPKLVVDMGFAPKAAAGVLTWANVGGATGVVIFGLIATRVGLKALTIRRPGRLVGHGHLVRSRPAGSCGALEHGGGRRPVHQRRHWRILPAVRQGFSDACTRDGHRLRDRRGPRGRGAGARHCRVSAPGGIRIAGRRHDDGHGLAAVGGGAAGAQGASDGSSVVSSGPRSRTLRPEARAGREGARVSPCATAFSHAA